MQTFQIYRMRDPRDGQVRYVGQTMGNYAPGALKNRLYGHFSQKDNARKYMWICELRRDGLVPIIEPIEVVIQSAKSDQPLTLALREKFWIQHYRDEGCDLFNIYPLVKTRGCG